MLKRTCVFLLLLTMAAVGAVACLDDGGDQIEGESGDVCADGVCDQERVDLELDTQAEADQEAIYPFLQQRPGESALWCTVIGCDDPNLTCCQGHICRPNPDDADGIDPVMSCTYYDYWGKCGYSIYHWCAARDPSCNPATNIYGLGWNAGNDKICGPRSNGSNDDPVCCYAGTGTNNANPRCDVAGETPTHNAGTDGWCGQCDTPADPDTDQDEDCSADNIVIPS